MQIFKYHSIRILDSLQHYGNTQLKQLNITLRKTICQPLP